MCAGMVPKPGKATDVIGCPRPGTIPVPRHSFRRTGADEFEEVVDTDWYCRGCWVNLRAGGSYMQMGITG